MVPQRPRLVAFHGRAGSGKSEATNHFVNQGFMAVKFASILKAMLVAYLEMCGLDREQINRYLEGDLKEMKSNLFSGKTPRIAMQTLGGDWGRDLIGSDVWVKPWLRKVQRLMDGGHNVVCDDLRHENEEHAIRLLGGEIYTIHRKDHKDVPLHPSEEYEPDADEVITNDGTLEQFRAKILRL